MGKVSRRWEGCELRTALVLSVRSWPASQEGQSGPSAAGCRFRGRGPLQSLSRLTILPPAPVATQVYPCFSREFVA